MWGTIEKGVMSTLKISKHSDVPEALDLVREVLNKEMKLAVHGDTNTAIMGKEKLVTRDVARGW